MSSDKFRSLQDMFGSTPGAEQTEKKREILDIALDEIFPYPKRDTFKPYTDQMLQDLADSIKENGVYSPVHLRPRPAGGYELIAGHNRWEGSKLAGQDTIPAIVQDMDDETADILFVDSNLKQRDKIAISERAKAYRLQYEATKRQGKRTDLVDSESNSKRLVDQMAENDNMAATTFFRYVRLGYLCNDLLDLMDLERFGIKSGVELSYISEPSQQEIAYYLQEHDKVKVLYDHAAELRELALEHNIDKQAVTEVLTPPVKEKAAKLPNTIKIPTKRIRDAFSGEELEHLDDQALTELCIKAIFAYQSKGMEESHEQEPANTV